MVHIDCQTIKTLVGELKPLITNLFTKYKLSNSLFVRVDRLIGFKVLLKFQFFLNLKIFTQFFFKFYYNIELFYMCLLVLMVHLMHIKLLFYILTTYYSVINFFCRRVKQCNFKHLFSSLVAV